VVPHDVIWPAVAMNVMTMEWRVFQCYEGQEDTVLGKRVLQCHDLCLDCVGKRHPIGLCSLVSGERYQRYRPEKLIFRSVPAVGTVPQ